MPWPTVFLALGLLAYRASAVRSLGPDMVLGAWATGSASFWGGPQDGNEDSFDTRLPAGACGYGEQDPKLYPFYNVVSVSPNSSLVASRPQASCGTCLEVQCTETDIKICPNPNATVTVMVTDVCPACAASDINIHAFGFEQLGRLKYGSMHVRYRQVECAPVDNITVRVDAFRIVQGGWLRLSLKSVASDGGIISVELSRSPDAVASTLPANATAAAGVPALTSNGSAIWRGNAWRAMDNTYGAGWELSGLPAPPFDLRVTDTYGRSLVMKHVITEAGVIGEFSTKAQFAALDNATVTAATLHTPDPSGSDADPIPVAVNATAPVQAVTPARPAAPATPLAAASTPKKATIAPAAPLAKAAVTTPKTATPVSVVTIKGGSRRRMMKSGDAAATRGASTHQSRRSVRQGRAARTPQ